MLALLVIAPLLCSQHPTDAPTRSARLLTPEVQASPAWVKPMLIATGAATAIPILVGTAFAAMGNLLGLAIAGGAAIGTIILFGAIMLGLALDDDAARSKRTDRLAVWPWVTTALSLLPITGVIIGDVAIVSIGLPGASFYGLMALLTSGIFLGPVFVGLLITGLVAGLVNAARSPEVLAPVAGSLSLGSRSGLALLSF